MNIEPVVVPQVQLDAPLAAVAPAVPDHALPPPTPQQARVADHVFGQEKEASAVAGLFGMWSATLLLHDLMAEHLSRPDELAELRRKQEGSQPDPHEPEV